jgi:hypothetical protein
MGIARLLAKGWVVFCLFAAAHAVRFAVESGTAVPAAAATIGVCSLLFVAMGLLFVAGYAAASDHGNAFFRRLKPRNFIPSFYGVVFIGFVVLSFIDQAAFAPNNMQNGPVDALRAAMHFAVPGQRALESALSCGLDGGRIFASAFTWLLAIVYLAAAASRVRLTAGLIRIERAKRAQALSPAAVAAILGVAAVVGFQLLYMGTAFAFLPCSAYTEVSGALLIGLAPLMLAYVIVAAAANLLAVGSE